MKNVLFINYTNILGGAEYVLMDYIYNNHEHNYYIYTSNNKIIVEKYKEIFGKNKVFFSSRMNIVSIRKNPVKSFFNIIINLYKIHYLVKKYDISVIYGNNTLDIVLLTLYKKYKNKNIKTISHIHDIIEKRLYRFYIQKYKNYIDKFIVPSIATKESLEKVSIDKKKIEVVYNGLSIINKNFNYNNNFIRKTYNIPNDKKILCIIGQVCQRKNQKLFIDIINKINEKNNKYIGIIVGKISEYHYFNSIKENIKYPIIYLGEFNREEIYSKIYPNIDALILVSDRDPLPTVILEAMNNNVLVIARNVDGVNEIIKNKENGILFNYEDKIEDILLEIEGALELSKDKINNIKYNAMKTIEKNFNIENKIKKINNIINNI